MSGDLVELVAAVPDPELPVVTIGELGILRGVEVHDGRVVVKITPTYSGCPALAEIAADVRRRLTAGGWSDVSVESVLRPAWTSDWITEAGRRKLAAAGVAPPVAAPTRSGPRPLQLGPTVRTVRCPQCGSPDTTERATFAATACTALYGCLTCGEPFEYLKEI